MRKIPIRLWILLAFVFFSILAINPSPWAEGVQIKNVESGSLAAEQGLGPGQIIKEINNQPINTITDFANAMKEFEISQQEITVLTDLGIFTYNITGDIGFDVDQNLTIINAKIFTPLQKDMTIKAVNGIEVENFTSLNKAFDELIPKKKIIIRTDKGEYAFLTRTKPTISVKLAEKTNLKQGLDLKGGSRVLIQPVTEEGEKITEKNIQDLISVLTNRLDVYGLSDIRIRSAKDWMGNKFVLVEIAGATREEVKELIGKQGKFEAKIGNETVFEGGKKDIPFVCRGDGSCSGIRQCNPTTDQWHCKFEFSIHLSPEAAKKHANATKDLDIIISEEGKEILSGSIDFYLDNKIVDSLRISADLKGAETTAIAISGPGIGTNKMMAVDAAISNMDKLQTILITGSLPFDIQIVKLDSISPTLGQKFVKNTIFVGLIAILGVVAFVTIRYKTWKIIMPMVVTCLSEIIIILGFASLISWNLDMAAIAGIIAAVGTGVDDQIVIVDEVLRGTSERYYSWKQKIKRAFFIIMVAYATTVAAMIPLWNAGAGLIRGFAVTIIVGVTVGVFLTRPAFASMIEKTLKK